MALEIPEITGRNQVGDLSDRELLEAIYARLLEVERMYLAWQTGGLRGLRAARRG
jgi:hypothetical protein